VRINKVQLKHFSFGSFPREAIWHFYGQAKIIVITNSGIFGI